MWKFYIRDVVPSLPSPASLPPPGGLKETAQETAEDAKLHRRASNTSQQLLQEEEGDKETAYQISCRGASSPVPDGAPPQTGTIGREEASGPGAAPSSAPVGTSREAMGTALRELFASTGERRGLCSPAISEGAEGEAEGTAGSDLGPRAAAAMQLVRCFDRATVGVSSRYRLPRAARGGNPNSIFCAVNDAAAETETETVNNGRATVAISSVTDDRAKDKEEEETEMGWRMLSIPEYEQKHNKSAHGVFLLCPLWLSSSCVSLCLALV